MEPTSNNPLFKNFRQPAIYITLPSKGKYWKEGSVDIPVTGEIPVYPMTAKDEITLRTPDALLNGESVIKVIQSCCPNIANAWEMPSIDVDYVLISIRIASYGENMDVNANCPSCEEENEYAINLHSILESKITPSFNKPIEIDGLQIFLKPQNYFGINKENKIKFTEQQLIASLGAEGVSEEERVARFNELFSQLINMNFESLSESTEKIITVDGEPVTDKQYILEFYQNCKGSIVKKLQTHIGQINADAAIKPVDVTCHECGHPYKLNLTFDYANFFA